MMKDEIHEKGGDNPCRAQHGPYCDELKHTPAVGFNGGSRAVARDHEDGDVVQDRQKNDLVRAYRFHIEDKDYESNEYYQS